MKREKSVRVSYPASRVLALAAAALLSPALASGYDLHSKALVPIREDAAPAGPPMAFVRDGRCDFRLVCDATDRRQKKAAKMLADCFEKTVGARPGETGRFVLRFTPNDGTAEPEDFTVLTSPAGVTLAGHAWHAAVDFAERFLGVRWYYPRTGVVYPKVRDLTIAPVRYSDAPWYARRGSKWYPYTAVCTPAKLSRWQKYMPGVGKDEAIDFVDYWRDGGSLPSGGSHSPDPEWLARCHTNELKTIFYTSPYGKFWYNPNGHVGNYYDVLNFDFAELLIRDWKDYYSSKGKIDRGKYREHFNDTFISFGCCDTLLPISEIRSHPTVRELGLFRESDLARDPQAAMCNIYARFYNYLGRRVKEEFPDKRLFLLIYYNSKYASLDRRFPLPDNVELNVCDGRLPTYVRNPEVMANSVRLFREWYEASGNRPALKAWLYAAGANRFHRAICPEFVGEVKNALGKYMGRGGLFYDFGNGWDLWHYFWALYVGWHCQWNPDFDVDAAVDAMMDDLYGRDAGAWMKKFHADLKDAFVRYIAFGKDATHAYPISVVNGLERDLAEARKRIRPGTVEMRRFELVADYWPEAFASQRALASYEPPVHEVRRRTGAESDWSGAQPLPLLDAVTGERLGTPAEVRLLWDEKGLYGRVNAKYAPQADPKGDIWANDSVEIFLVPGLGKEVEHQLVFDTLGRSYAKKKRHRPIPQPPDASYRGGGFTHRATVREKDWSAEFFIPWTAIEGPAPKVYDHWNVNVVVNRPKAAHPLMGTAYTLGTNGNMDMFGILRFEGRGD